MKPILFNEEMVKAILEGRKIVTRRLVKPQPPENARLELVGDRRHAMDLSIEIPGPDDHRIYTPPYLPGDILYVRETWSTKLSNERYGQPCRGGVCPHESCESATGSCFPEEYIYKASDSLPNYGGKWHPSIHMPKEAARLFLLVTDVRAEQLQQITEIGARNEGADSIQIAREIWSYRKGFERIWDSTINPVDLSHYGWAANPWVWVIEFERCENPDERSL